MLGHMRDLSSHSEHEESEEVYNENRPENRDIESFAEGAQESHHAADCKALPKAILRQLAYKWLELIFVVDRQDWMIFLLYVQVCELGGEEAEEEVQQVDR